MNSEDNNTNICQKCGNPYEGEQCPNCTPKEYENLIDDKELKLDILNTALLHLLDTNVITKEDNINSATATFDYLFTTKENNEHFILAALIIKTAINEYHFIKDKNEFRYIENMQLNEYDTLVRETKRNFGINPVPLNQNKYIVPVKLLKNYGRVECMKCHEITNPYNITCNGCHIHLAEDYPTYFADFKLNTVVGNKNYNITFILPKNLQIIDDGKKGYLTLMNEDGPSFVSYKFNNESCINMPYDNNITELKEVIYLEKELKSKYVQFDNGDVIYTGEVKLRDDLYCIIEYQINKVKSPKRYDEKEIKKYLAIIYTATIEDNGIVQETITPNAIPIDINDNIKQKKNNTLLIVLIVIASILILFLIGLIIYKNSNVVMKNKIFDIINIKIPSNYKEGSINSLQAWNSNEYENDKCKIELKKYERIQLYNFEKNEYEENNYSPDELYDGITLQEQTINNKTWYYHSTEIGKYYYDYIFQNKNIRVIITSNDDEYCKVKEIVNSLDTNN